MDISGFANNIGVVIIGGVIVITVAFFMFRPKRNDKKSEKQGVDAVPGEHATNGPEKIPSSTVETGNDQPSSPIKETRRFLLDKMRKLKKPDIIAGKAREEKNQSADSEEEISSEMTLPIEDTSVVTPEVDESDDENLRDSPDIEVQEQDEEKPETLLSTPVEDTDQDLEEMEKPNMFTLSDNNGSPKADVSLESTDDETEDDDTQLEAAVENKVEVPEKPKGAGGVFDLFTEVEEEENDISKFAANLDPVDVNDLLQEAKDIHKHLRR